MRRSSILAAVLLILASMPVVAQEPAPNLCLQVDAPAELDTVEAWQIPQLIASGEIAVLAVVSCGERADAEDQGEAMTGDFLGDWWVTDIIGASTDSGVLAMAATEAVTGTSRTGQPYTLVIRCSDGEIDMFVTWNEVIDAEQPLVQVAVGSGAAQGQTWNRSTDRLATFYPGEDLRSFIESLYGEGSLVISTTPVGSEPWVADFPIEDIESALINVRSACDW
jgi:hypothetical protein